MLKEELLKKIEQEGLGKCKSYDLAAEAKLIKEKKSGLSASQREKVITLAKNWRVW